MSNTLSSGAPSEELDETEDSINVVVRVRPLSKQETERRDKNCIEFPGDGALHIDLGLQNKTFTFNVTFEPEANQGDVFEHSGIKKLIDMALNGYACTAFAFGQTGSGKTHTITGPPEMTGFRQLWSTKTPEGAKEYQEKTKMKEELTGLIPRSFRYLLQQMNVQKGNAFRITASYLEIYNEQVVDLLNTNMRQHLSVRWSKHRGFYVENLFVIECETLDDLMAVLEEGLKNRQTGSNSVNEESSRSHSLLTLQIDSEMQDPEDENLYITKHGKLTFVDLAGSEKVKDTAQATSEHWVESNNINKSLLVLGNCIAALGDPKRRQGHIPYRDSKLTKLLADSLGGSGVTLMIACVTPSSYNGAESMNTLRYANRAKKIKNKPTVKMDPREALIMSLKREVKILRQENHYLRQQLEFPVKPRGKLQKENDEKFLKMVKEQGKVEDGKTEGAVGESTKTTGENVKITDNGLYEMLQEYMIENETLRSENSHIHQVKDQSAREQQFMAMENERLQRKLEEIERQRVYMNTPMSIHSLASTTTSRRSSAMDTQYPQDPTPLGTPYWGQPHDMPYGSQPYGYQQYGGSQPYGTNQVGYYREPPPGSWQPEMTRPTDLPLGPEPSPRPQNGYTPPGGPSSKRTPPTHLQHPMKPPHRLAEPVMRPSQGGYRGADSSYSSQYQREQDYQRVHPPLAGPAAGQTPRGQVPMGGTPGQPKGQQRAPPPVSYQQQYQQRNSPNVPNWDPLPAGQPPQPTPRRSKASSQASIQSQPALSPRRTASENNETETYQDMNDRLRQELVDLENQIRTQQQLSSPTKAAAGSGATGGKR